MVCLPLDKEVSRVCMWVQHSPKVDWLHDPLATISEACSVASGQGSKVAPPPSKSGVVGPVSLWEVLYFTVPWVS